nr:putative ribonuclease H-like domain-containing protein [Tanacetum cinerariifolium]
IRSDNGTEFKNNDLNQFCGMKGIKREISVPRTPKQNGIAERKNKTLIEAARTMLADSLLPIPFWVKAVNTACYVQNRVLVTKPHNTTPYELLHGSGSTWLFDIDSLTRTMNYQPVTVGNQSNPSACFQDKFDAEKAREEINQQYVLFLVWSSGSINPQNSYRDATFDRKEPEFDEKKPESEVNVSPSSSAQSRKQDNKTKKEAKGKIPVEYFTGYRDLSEEFKDNSDNSINDVNAAGTLVPTVGAASATISAAKPSIHVTAPTVVIPAAALTVVTAYTRKRKGVIIRDLEEELSSKTPTETPTDAKLKDKGKGIMIEKPKPMKKKDQIKLDAEYARKLHEEINKDINWDAAIDHTKSKARKNMMVYLRNTAGYKLDFFKGMSYDDMHLIFQARFDANKRFLLKTREQMEEEDQEALKSINETLSHKAAKRRKLNEEAQEVEDLKKHLEIVPDEDDDVYTKATPLARKVPVVDYQIVLINNKPRYKIIKAAKTYQLYISFITLLKNFDREDLEDLWRIVKERFSTSKPNNFSDEYLLSTLEAMFEKPDGQVAVWKIREVFMVKH